MTSATADLARRNRVVAGRAVLFVLFMIGLAYASVPLYRIFCQATGFGGTPMRASAAPGAQASLAPVGVRFDANVSPAMPWDFKPETRLTRVVPGARIVTYFTAHNLTARETTGTASFNVSPAQAGQYFSKLECFCFTEQTLKPGQRVQMPVVFFVDPKIRTDPATASIDEITLSYTFYPVEKRAEAR
ncbi:cytochrome c oxidase assembly protein [Sphingomonas astaxanthinifaciens]|uniref:Cytochrome c oxidase assembly protein CtaG n=1 Tax=Sphingomonas astaxanthinifaciens DSM 22298 TaxID=1123267 RepID=A0ABQ5Z8H0_9SPHN|nr:cytochrome c oxidase assembly protein [Sphingomonas astaxanthinifaciens]GLR47930.1 cytochrome c oxidase assembly protein CtaG [Sphingomonas astaxanthinifaciens DSM 22298]